jgi:hypothetical protein
MGTIEELFEGEPTGLPAPVPRGGALYQEGSGPSAKVRHAGGYAPFIDFCSARGVPAEDLASDVERLIWFLREVGPEIECDSALAAAAAIFTGNAIARLRPDAHWAAYQDGSRSVGSRDRQFETDRLVEGLRSADDGSVGGLVSALSEWAQEEVVGTPAVRPVPVPPTAGQPLYLRPPLPAMTYYSPEGELIPYGRRWAAGGPAPDSYSEDSHPERFGGLHTVALALIDHLAAAYDVDVDTDLVHAKELLGVARNVVEAVRVTPRRRGAARLTFVLTSYPGVVVHAGVLHDFPFPVCGCDACDETAETAAERMEMLVLTEAAGGFSERYPVGSRRWCEYALTAVDGSGSESGRGEPGPVAAGRLQDAEIRLREMAGGWSPWPLRESPGR